MTYKPAFTPSTLLESAMFTQDLEQMFAKAVPKEYHYITLQEALFKYLEMQRRGGWEHLPLKGKLALGKTYDVVPALRERLGISGDYKGCASPENTTYNTQSLNCQLGRCMRFVSISFYCF